MQSSFSVAIPSRDILGESPWWCNKEQVLWRVDILSKRVFKWDYNTNTQNTWRLKDKVGCFVKTQHKNIALVALSDGAHLLHLEENRTEHLAPPRGSPDEQTVQRRQMRPGRKFLVREQARRGQKAHRKPLPTGQIWESDKTTRWRYDFKRYRLEPRQHHYLLHRLREKENLLTCV